jgi:hypothetical protein
MLFGVLLCLDICADAHVCSLRRHFALVPVPAPRILSLYLYLPTGELTHQHSHSPSIFLRTTLTSFILFLCICVETLAVSHPILLPLFSTLFVHISQNLCSCSALVEFTCSKSARFIAHIRASTTDSLSNSRQASQRLELTA